MKTIHHPELGAIQYKKSKRAKKIRITLRPFKGVVVTLPQAASYQRAEAFVEQQKAWILKQQEKVSAHENSKSYDFGQSYTTKFTTIKIIKTAEEHPYLKQKDKILYIAIPQLEDILQAHWQELIRTQIEEQLRREAKAYLIPRTYQIAKEKQINVGKVSVRKAKTRWGSCSGRNNISLSIYCMTLPDELMDYIIYHELAHVKEKNHSPAFWSHLETLLPGAGKLDKALRAYQTSI